MDDRGVVSAVDEQHLADDMDRVRLDPLMAPGRWVLDFAYREDLLDTVQLAIALRQEDQPFNQLGRDSRDARRQLVIRALERWDERIAWLLEQIAACADQARKNSKSRKAAAAVVAAGWHVPTQFRDQANRAFLNGYAGALKTTLAWQNYKPPEHAGPRERKRASERLRN